MNADDKFQQLWRSRKTAPAPDIKALLEKAAKVKGAVKRKLILSYVLLIATIFWACYIVAMSRPKMITTWIGVALAIMAILLYLASSAGLIKQLFAKGQEEVPVQEYLQNMLQIREKQRYLQRGILNAYFILLFSGLALYMIEYTSHLSITTTLMIYGAVTVWGLINWFYFRKKAIAKQEQSLGAVISKLEAVIADTKD
ncbi:hypothetical protein SAMN05444266_101686 [Chitinophaga jiangningensis]|uniref:Uncharacterized protein n=1 Tax=Chitinophaga jiangningensis TaxID=1419482 RepID=A0A1M6WLU8_9BACT|nr:hypothetical protein [Chitinophaga jiangningensis]SHK94750.1 hypothetical protein SAMN05444266_101686 [Chitinophaga jiangningensis]